MICGRLNTIIWRKLSPRKQCTFLRWQHVVIFSPKHWIFSPFVLQISLLSYETQWQNALLTEIFQNLFIIISCCTYKQLFLLALCNIYSYSYIYFLLITTWQVLEFFCNVQCYRFSIPWNKWEQLNVTNKLCDICVNIHTQWGPRWHSGKGAMLQIGRSLVRSQLVPLEFFINIKSLKLHYGPGVDSASNRNEYQEHFLGVKAAGA